MVGHTFLYSEPVRMLRRLMDSGDLGRVLYTYAQRLNLGVIREDLNALWNFGPHDISIFLYLLDAMPVRVSARQFRVLNRRLEDVAFLVLEFPDGVVGHIHESWLDPRKVRELTVVGDHKMVVYDDTDVESPLRIYDKGVSPLPRPVGESSEAPPVSRSEGFGEFKLQVRAGDLLIPRVVGPEPLRAEIEHFVSCAATGTKPLSDGAHGRDVVAVLEAAELLGARRRQGRRHGRGSRSGMGIPLLDMQAQIASVKDELDAAIAQVIAHGKFVAGPEVKAFEACVGRVLRRALRARRLLRHGRR